MVLLKEASTDILLRLKEALDQRRFLFKKTSILLARYCCNYVFYTEHTASKKKRRRHDSLIIDMCWEQLDSCL